MKIIINDTIDLRADFGTIALQGHLRSVITPPVLKPFDFTEWADEHGTDYDTTNPVFDIRSVAIPFYSTSELNYRALVGFLEQSIENKWHFEAISRSYTLRLINNGNVVQRDGRWWFTLTFLEDMPTLSETTPEMVEHKTGYTIDGVDFGSFGCRFLQGHIQEVGRPFTPKKNLIISSKHTPGQHYPDRNTYFQNKQVRFPMYFRGENVLSMLDSLVWKLSRPGFREFGIETSSDTFKFIHKSIEVVEFTAKEWLKINLNLEFENSNLINLLIDKYCDLLIDDENSTLRIIL